MDRSLQERLAGAVVLVALAVWLIPQVLDGPAGNGQGSAETLQLPAPTKDTGLRTQTIRLDQNRDTPTPAAEQNSPVTPVPAAKPQATQAVVAAGKSAAKPAVSGSVDWFVQLGSFADRGNASKLAEDVVQLGFSAEVSRHDTASAVLHRVRVGPRPSRIAAEALASDLARRGFKGQVVQDG